MRDLLAGAEAGAGKSKKSTAAHDKPGKFASRFYKTVNIAQIEGGYAVHLDGKVLKTPGRNPVILPSNSAAECVAEEWQAQKTQINPLAMPVTRIVNTSIDGIARDPQAVLEDIVRFAGSDLLFYRAAAPESLVALQTKHWDPVLDWVGETIGAHFETCQGVIHIAQPKDALQLFSVRLLNHAEPFKLACLHTFTTLCGSALIALALAEGYLTLDTAWAAAHVDEDFNISRWGEDFEAAKRRQARFVEFKAALALCHAL